MALTYGSVCSGIEAATVAWEPLGWRAAWFAEIEKFPAQLLAHHYPAVPNLGDMTKIAALVRCGLVAAPDVLVGGTPCQAFSVAGVRAGLNDPRGQLTLSYVDLANAIDERRPGDECITYWENVPGVLSDKTNAFGCFLGLLAGESDALVSAGGKWPNAGAVYGPQRAIAWRVLDAQYFGVAQRRRRLFVVASARDGFDPASLLFEFEGVRRDTAPSRETGQDITHDLAPCLTSSGRGVERTGDTRGQDPVVAVGGRWPADVACTLDTQFGDKWGQNNQHVNAGCPLFVPAARYAPEIARCDAAREGTSQDYETTTMVAQAVCVTEPVTHTLRAEGFDASEDGTGRGQPIVAHAFDILGTPASEVARATEVHTPLRARVPGQFENSTVTVVRTGVAVRRLTPRECERLQAFPDDYTYVPVLKGKRTVMAADGPRYKTLGNSMCVYNMRWLALRMLATHPKLFMR